MTYENLHTETEIYHLSPVTWHRNSHCGQFFKPSSLSLLREVRLASGHEAETMFDDVSAARHSQARLAFRRELETVELGDCAEEVIAGFVSRAPRLSDLR